MSLFLPLSAKVPPSVMSYLAQISIAVAGMTGIVRAEESGAVPEIWMLARTGDSLETIHEILRNPSVNGVVYYTSLRKVEPRRGEFDWSGIDAVLEVCRKEGKPLKLAILGGRWMPDWIFEAGARPFDWIHETKHVDAGREEVRSCVPWDPVYLGAMEGALRTAGARYQREKLLEAVQVTGPELANGLETFLASDRSAMEAEGYTLEKLVAAWGRMVAAAAEAFPRQRISLALHNDLLGERTLALSGRVRDEAVAKYGDRISLLVCYATHEDWFGRGNPAVDVWLGGGDNLLREAQLIDLYSAKSAPRSWPGDAIRRARSLGAEKIEVFAGDLGTEAYREAIIKACWSDNTESPQQTTLKKP